jgi:hypothetical protein
MLILLERAQWLDRLEFYLGKAAQREIDMCKAAKID